ncbi:hypothetical protein [Mycolicibacterium litorale]|nr:hypothetical protein [Mycolicibacterium litorale]
MTQPKPRSPLFEQGGGSCRRTVVAIIQTLLLLCVLVGLFVGAWLV